jgi:integrase
MKPVRAALGKLPAIGVTDDIIRDYVLLRLKGTGKKAETPMAQELGRIGRTRPVSNATVNRELQFLGQAYNLRQKEIGLGPLIPKLKERVREGFFERAEFEAIAAHLPEDLQDFAHWAYFTGWRKGEISSLGWNELNIETRHLRLRGQFRKTGSLGRSPWWGSSGTSFSGEGKPVAIAGPTGRSCSLHWCSRAIGAVVCRTAACPFRSSGRAGKRPASLPISPTRCFTISGGPRCAT